MITLICGLPRAGKTTLSGNYKCKVYHGDYNMHKCYRVKDDVACVEGIFVTPSMREKVIRDREDFKLCVYLDTNREILSKRGFKNDNATCSEPTLEEGWDKIIIVKDNDYKNAKVIMKDSNLKGDLADG